MRPPPNSKCMAIRKHPNVTISAGSASLERMRFSHAASTARGIGVASDLSNGTQVFDLRKSETVWLCKELSTMVGRVSKKSNVKL